MKSSNLDPFPSHPNAHDRSLTHKTGFQGERWSFIPRIYAPAHQAFASPNIFDVLLFILVACIFIILGHGLKQASLPFPEFPSRHLDLDLKELPFYTVRTVLRLLLGLLISVVLTFIIATAAAKNRIAGRILIPLCDILQSVPVLGFQVFIAGFFLRLFPLSQLGGECIALFVVVTSQIWNMIFSFYQSLKTVPKYFDEVARHFRLSGWQRFWRLDVPFAIPSLVWNGMMSLSGSWFFIVASEMIDVSGHLVILPGIGSWVGTAISTKNVGAIFWAIGAMVLALLACDQLIFRPLTVWSQKFRCDTVTPDSEQPSSWVLELLRKTRLWGIMGHAIHESCTRLLQTSRYPLNRHTDLITPPSGSMQRFLKSHRFHTVIQSLSNSTMVVLTIGFVGWVAFISWPFISWPIFLHALELGFLTLLRVIATLIIATVIWVPIGIWIGSKPRWCIALQPIIQFLAAFPANLLFPLCAMGIVYFKLNPDIWLSGLMLIGAQWYIFFNVLAGMQTLPIDFMYVSKIYHLSLGQRWKNIFLPGIFPFYVTGALTATGGAWNASIITEVVEWGDIQIQATGLGSFIENAARVGNMAHVAAGLIVMTLFVLSLNRLVWAPLQNLAQRRFTREM
jgi:NitT/TauT family transport system permease protein